MKQPVKEHHLTEQHAPKDASLKKEGMKSMREMAAHVTRHHLAPLPEAHLPELNPFPAPVMRALGLGVVGGFLLGLLWGVLLRSNFFAVPGWEGLYSMTPFTFLVFWAMMGAALGGLVLGVAGILRTPVEDTPDKHLEHHRNQDQEEDHQKNKPSE